jgi:hypothetical protein
MDADILSDEIAISIVGGTCFPVFVGSLIAYNICYDELICNSASS